MSDSPWLTPAEAGLRARRHEETVTKALRSGELRGHQGGKRGHWTIHIEDVDAWVRGELADITVPKVVRKARAS